MQKHKQKKTHDSLTQLTCFNCRRSGSFWVVRGQDEEQGKVVLLPTCSRCVKFDDEVVYDDLDHGLSQDNIWESAVAERKRGIPGMSRPEETMPAIL